MRAPLYEEKVVDFLVELAKVTDKQVTREELYKEDDETSAAGDRAPCGAPPILRMRAG